MKKMILVVLSLLVFATSAFAVPIGQLWEESGVGLFDKMEMFMISDNDFTADSRITTTGTGWQTELANPDYLLFSGPAVSSIQFYTGFADTAAPTLMHFLAFKGSSFLEAAEMEWMGSNWKITTFTPDSADLSLYQEMREAAAPVPEPSTFMLAGLGIGALFFVRRKQSGFRQGSLA